MAKGTFSKTMILGRLGRDPEVKQTQNGSSICKLALATVDGYKEKENTEWHNVVLFGKQAEAAGKYLKKGARAYVEGVIRTTKYEDKHGNPREIKEIIATDLQFVDKAEESTDDKYANKKEHIQYKDDLDDGSDLPF